jgi:hypothetical protein
MEMPFSRPFEMTTPLPVKEVVRRLRARVPQFMSFPVPTVESPVAGRVGERSCVLRLRYGLFMNRVNCIRVLDLRFIAMPDGTLLSGQFRLVWYFWFWAALSYGVLVCLFRNIDWKSSLGGKPEDFFPYLFLIIVFIMAVLGTVYSIWGSRGAEPQLEEFLRETLGESVR